MATCNATLVSVQRAAIIHVQLSCWLAVQGGIITSDRVCTVSPGYAWEIQTPEGGWGLEGLLRSRAYALNGVLNGIDDRDWNPQVDPHIAETYSPSNFSHGKAANKAALQRELGLPERPDVRPGSCSLLLPALQLSLLCTAELCATAILPAPQCACHAVGRRLDGSTCR